MEQQPLASGNTPAGTLASLISVFGAQSATAQAEADRMSAAALRVLAIARRVRPDDENPEEALTLLGLVGMMDPPRPGVADAIATCAAAGVRAVEGRFDKGDAVVIRDEQGREIARGLIRYDTENGLEQGLNSAQRWRRVLRPRVIIYTSVLLVIAAPPWGQDFGGALSDAPAYALFLWLAAGRRLTRRAVAWLALALVGAGLLVGFLDLLRPSGSRTHVGRFFEKVGNEGLTGFWTVISRKAGLMLQTFLVPTWVLASIGLLLFLAFLAWGTPWLSRLAAALPSLRAGGTAFAVMAVLGLLLNDSGVTVPGMMLAVLVPCLLALTVLQPAAEAGGADPEPPVVADEASPVGAAGPPA